MGPLDGADQGSGATQLAPRGSRIAVHVVGSRTARGAYGSSRGGPYYRPVSRRASGHRFDHRRRDAMGRDDCHRLARGCNSRYTHVAVCRGCTLAPAHVSVRGVPARRILWKRQPVDAERGSAPVRGGRSSGNGVLRRTPALDDTTPSSLMQRYRLLLAAIGVSVAACRESSLPADTTDIVIGPAMETLG